MNRNLSHQSETPNLDKQIRFRDESQAIGEFLEWLNSNDIVLASYTDGHNLTQVQNYTDNLLAQFFGIDLEAAEAEKRQILEGLRSRA